MTEENISSGFLDDIGGQLNYIPPMTAGFSDIRECYVSKSGYTRLFRARRFGKTYILKCLKKDYLYTSLYRMALNKEFEIGLQLEHGSICRTIGLEEVNELGPTIVLEYIDGETLESFMRKGVLTKPLARKFMGQLADALDYMHNKQTIHRDLKPSNIMVTHKGLNIKLIDFSLSDNDTFNVLKAPGGTSGYIAPELFLPNAKSDIRCDIYSFGVLMCSMAEATGDRAMMKTGRLCMNHDVERRPQTVEEIPIPSDTGVWQILILIFLSLTAIALCISIVVRLLQIL